MIKKYCEMDFSPNKALMKIIKEGAFGGTYFRDIYWDIYRDIYLMKNGIKIHGKNLFI